MDENQMDEFDNIRLEFLGWTNRDGLIFRSVVSAGSTAVHLANMRWYS